jgi:hypothetical protein
MSDLFSSWGPVDNEGIKERTRVRTQKPLNGGTGCPQLEQKKEGSKLFLRKTIYL